MEAEQAEEELLYMKLQELALQPNLKSREGEHTSLSGVFEDHHVINELTLEDIENPREPWGLEEKRGESPHYSSEQKSGEGPRSLTEYQAIIAKLIQEVEELKTFKIQEVEEVKAFKTEFTKQSKKIDYLEHKLFFTGISGAGRGGNSMLKFCLRLESRSTPSKAHTDEKDTESWNVLHYDPDESIYLVGGYDGESCLSAFDAYYPSEDKTKPPSPMSAVRSYVSAAQLYGNLYVIGGSNGQVCYDTDVEMLDLDVGRWIHTQSMLQKRMALAAVELKGVLYATGGYDGNSYLNTVDRFDPRDRSWTKIASMHSKRSCHLSVVLSEKMGYSAAAVVEAIYVIGGMKDDETIAETVEYYKEGQDWREMATMTIGRRCFMSAAASST
ncbi:unnamed protein product [Malus baccata var. baccata]